MKIKTFITGKNVTKAIAAMLAFILSLTIIINPISSYAYDSQVMSVTYNNIKIFYSDNYFRHPSTEYDPHLATTSIIMTENTVPREEPKNANDTEWYNNQPKYIEGFFDAIGFEDFETNEDYRKRSDFDTIGVAAARRQMDDYTIVAVTVRSGSYYREWANNVWLGDGTKSDNMHEGWYNAANKLIAFLDSYVSTKNITGKIKLWITGFSRGGATANLAAGLIDNKLYKNQPVFSNGATLEHDDLYAYTFEAPQGANYNSKTVELPGHYIYNNIWNVVNPNDLVTKVAFDQYGFARFGTDKFITTRFFDPDNFRNNRNTFEKFYTGNGNDLAKYKGDTMVMYGMPVEKATTLYTNLIGALYGNPSSIMMLAADALTTYLDECPYFEVDDRKANYDSNIVSTIFLEKLVAAIGTRNDYCRNIQEHMKKLLYIFMDDISSDVDAVTDELIPAAIASIILGAVAYTNTCGVIGASDVASLLAGLNGNSDLKAVADSVDPLMDVIIPVYNEIPNELITIAKSSGSIFDNHEHAVNIAHLMAQDRYYIDDYNNGRINWISIVSLRDNADFGRVSFFGFNDIGLHLDTGNGTKRMVSVDGYVQGRSDVSQCNEGYAVGYYSYATEEKMELFTPINQKYIINMTCFSKKPWHTISADAGIQLVGVRANGKIEDKRYLPLKSYIDEDEVFSSDLIQLGVNMRY